MTSYASVERIEGEFVVAEVELLPFEESSPEDYATKDTTIIDIELQEVTSYVGEVNEGDILVVEHDGENVTLIYYKDEEERKRRVEILSKMWR